MEAIYLSPPKARAGSAGLQAVTGAEGTAQRCAAVPVQWQAGLRAAWFARGSTERSHQSQQPQLCHPQQLCCSSWHSLSCTNEFMQQQLEPCNGQEETGSAGAGITSCALELRVVIKQQRGHRVWAAGATCPF